MTIMERLAEIERLTKELQELLSTDPRDIMKDEARAFDLPHD